MSHNFPRINPKQSFPKLEEEILQFWETEKIFAESVEREAPRGDFIFFDGPPFATGLPHYGHILQSVLKDTIPRYKTMAGYRVPRRWGWDCHGLPVENLIEKELGLADKQAIETLGVDKFNAACEASVLRYAKEWQKFIPRIGRWVDMEHAYKTMDKSYMESVWWVFGELWKKGLIYEGLKPMHICPRCVTPLSNFEVGLGYKDVTDLSCIAKFKVKNEENTYLLAWTTTPWTLPGNVALAVNAEVEYVKISRKKFKYNETQSNEIPSKTYLYNEHFICADKLKESIFPDWENEVANDQIQIVTRKKGAELVGLEYEPLFPYYSHLKSEYPNAFTVQPAEFVTTDDGTGIVHIAPAYGEDDLNLAKAANLPTIQHVGMDGKFAPTVANSGAEFAKFAIKHEKAVNEPDKVDVKITEWLDAKGLLFKVERTRHSTPLCWRCETQLLNYATASWFVAVEQIKPQLLAANEKVNWLPEHVKHGRFGQWLENARDWAISRNRFWGAPLPVWKCDACKKVACVSDVAELEKLSGAKIQDLHKQFVDKLTWPCDCGGQMHRVPEVLDCWFESGSMPYAQNAEKAAAKVPAQFIAEAQDQTRGWFYTLHVLAVALLDKPAYENVVCSGLILAEDGQKMSKSKKNYPDPNEIVQKYGADALRLYLLGSPVVRGEALRFSERGVEETLRGVLLPLWNTYYFFTTYATADGWTASSKLRVPRSENPLDKWILSELNLLTKELTDKLDAYELQDAVRPLAAFLDGLTNWYIRRSRRRFWKSESDADKQAAYATLFHVLQTAAQLLAPFCPFLAEEIYRGLTGERSVHLAPWPAVNESLIDKILSEDVAAVRQIVSLGLTVRARENIKTRQPLVFAAIALPVTHPEHRLAEHIATIREELNVKEVEIAADPTSISEVVLTINARAAGPRLGSQIQAVIAAARAGQFNLWDDGRAQVGDALLEPSEFDIGYRWQAGQAAAGANGFVVALETKISPELEREGRARDLVRAIQDLRKKAELDVSDRIVLALSGADDLLADAELRNYIATETLTVEIVPTLVGALAAAETEGVQIGVKKAPTA